MFRNANHKQKNIMKDYYCYNHNDQFVRAFATAEEGTAWINDQVRQWREQGRKGLVYRCCYNGTISSEVSRATS